MSSPVTIKDIAKALNISASTVSRALKDHPDISRETKDAVNALAARLRYKPNAVALSLKNSRTRTIGVIIPEVVHYFFSSVISGIEDVAYDAGYNVMVYQSNEKYAREVINSQALESNRIEGALVSVSKETHDYSHLQTLEENGIPVVYFDRAPENAEVFKVIIDDHKAAYNATSYLISTGCRRIAHLAAPSTMGIGLRRMEGYKKALEDNGIACTDELVVVADSFELAEDATRQLMHLPEPPDAIFAVNDMTAVGAMKTLQRMSVDVPKKVAICGFSAGFLSNITTPTLSSVDQHGYEMGEEAARLLLKRIEKQIPENQFTQFIDTHLVIRESTRRKN